MLSNYIEELGLKNCLRPKIRNEHSAIQFLNYNNETFNAVCLVFEVLSLFSSYISFHSFPLTLTFCFILFLSLLHFVSFHFHYHCFPFLRCIFSQLSWTKFFLFHKSHSWILCFTNRLPLFSSTFFSLLRDEIKLWSLVVFSGHWLMQTLIFK